MEVTNAGRSLGLAAELKKASVTRLSPFTEPGAAFSSLPNLYITVHLRI